MQRRTFAQWMAAAAALPLASGASTYPDKPVKVVVAFPGGQSVDVAARLVMERVATKMRQPFVIDNKAGAGGVLGTDYVAKSPADGYTLLFGSSSSLVINAKLYRKLPYDTQRDLQPVSHVAVAPMFLVVNNDLPVTNVKELVAYAKSKGGTLNYASAGNGLTNHLLMEMFKREAGIDLTHVPYKGSAAGLTDLVGGRVQVMFDAGPGALPFVQQGRLRALAISSSERSTAAPEIPTLREAGIPLEAAGWVGLMAPRNTPASIIQALSSEVEMALSTPEISQRLVQLGFEPKHMGPAPFHTYIAQELPRWGKAVTDSGATVD